jgi:hypothetical protein
MKKMNMWKLSTVFCIASVLFCARSIDLTGTITEVDIGCIIKGRVRHADGTNAFSVPVILHNQKNSPVASLGKIRDGIRSLTAYTNLEGIYKFDSVPPGRYFIESEDYDTLGALSSATIRESDSLLSVNLVLDQCGAIKGKIDTNAIAQKQNLSIYLPEVDRFYRIDSTGEFTLPNLPSGNYQLHIGTIDSLALFSFDSVNVVVAKGDTTDLSDLGETIFKETTFRLKKNSNTVALWNFNQLKDSIVQDESGHNNHGLLMGTAKMIAEDWGTGVEFSKGSGIKVLNDTSLQLANFEITARVFPTRFGKLNEIINKQPISGSYPGGYVLRFMDDGYLEGLIRDAGLWNVMRSLSPLELNAWYVIKFRKTIDSMFLYVNNILICTKKVAIDPSNETGDVGIGYDVNEVSDDAFQGYIDALQIDNLRGDGKNKGIIAWWSFDQFTDSTYKDITNYGFDLQPYDGPYPLSKGISGMAINCPADGYYFEILDSKRTLGCLEFAFEGWVNPASDSLLNNATECIISQQVLYSRTDIETAFGIYIKDSGKVDFCVSDTLSPVCYEAVSGKRLKTKEWSFIAATFDSKKLKLYINGELDASVDHRGAYLPPIAQNALIGSQILPGLDLGDFFGGMLDEIKFYNNALPPDSIQAHYNALKPQ